MKKRFTFLIAALALLVFMTPSLVGWGQTRTEEVVYTLDGTATGGSNAYAEASDITQNSINWKVTANTTTNPWRFGGKNLDDVDRPAYTTQALTSNSTNITKVIITTGTATATVNSIKLIVSSNSNFSNATTLTESWTVSSTITFNRPANDDWTDKYFKIVYNVDAGGSNQYAQFVKAEFYAEIGGGSQATATTTTIDASGITNTDVNTSTAAGSLSATVSANDEPIEGATVTWSGNNNAVATIDSDGVVTLVGAGTVTFKADYYGVSGTYQASYDEYEMTVTNSTPTVVDVLNCTWTGVTGSSSYSSWNNKAGSESDAVYAGNTARYTTNNSNAIQMRNTNSSGIVTTTSGGKVKKIEVTWNTGTSSSRTLYVYGKNIAYSGPGDLQNSTTRGTFIGSVTYNTSGTTTTVVNVDTDYEYVGLLAGGALYLDEIDITWLPNAVKTPTFSPAPGSYVGTQSVTISCETENATIYYTIDGTTPSASNGTQGTSVSISETTTIKAIAYVGEETSGVASGTFTIVQPLTSLQEVFDASNTSGNYYIAFKNWVVTGINTGGTSTRAYITDGEKGVCIYNNSGHGFSAGDKINGTIECLLNRSTGGGYAQINNITRTTVGLTVTNDGVATPANIALADLSGEHTGVLLSYNDLVYSSSGPTLSDGNTSVKPQGELISLSGRFIDGEKYHVTGIYINYTNYSGTLTRELCPRSVNDIVLAADLDIDASMTPFSYIVDNGPSAEQNIEVACTDLGTNTLTATASSDYEVSLAYDGTYTQFVELTPASGEVAETVYVRLKAGLSVGEHNGTVTFTAANLTTTTVNLEGLVSNAQTYAIDLTQPTGGIATISSDVAVAEAGATITLSYTIEDDCYVFSSWSVMYEDSEMHEITPDANNQFEMPAADVYVSAIFAQKTFTVNYSVNGIIYEALKTTGIECGSVVTLKTSSDLTAAGITLPTDYSFTGWSTSAASTEIVSSFIPEVDATLYAVLIPSNASNYVQVTSLQDITGGTYFIVSDEYVLPSATTSSAPVMSDAYKIAKPLSETYNILPVNGTVWNFTGNNKAMTIKNGNDSYLYATSANNGIRVGNTNDTWAFEINGTGFAMKDANNSRYCATTSNSDWRSYTTATSQYYYDNGVLYLYKKETPAAYTRIEEITSTETLSSIEPSYLITVENGGVLTLTGPNNGDASNLIIKDGGKLITYSTAVQATVEKDIIGAGDENWAATSGAGGWYFIASPVNTTSYATALTTGTEEDYDLYMLDWATKNWLNKKDVANSIAFGDGFTRGTGYLYASKASNTLSVGGQIQPLSNNDDATVTLANDGWNLIGNPLTCKVKVDHDFGMLNNGSTVDYTGTTVNPFQGIVVWGSANEVVTFTKAATQNAAAPSNNNSLQMSLAKKVTSRGEVSTKVVDNAVVSFNNSKGMPKFNMLGGNAKLYIPQNNEEYSIVFSDRQGDVPLYFKANETGTYTISFAGDEMSLNGIYLIDILAEEEIDLSVNPSYTFIGSPADRMARFKIVFRNANGDGTSDIFAYQNGNDIIVSGEGELQIFDVMGRMVSRQRVNGVETVNAMPYGVYILKLNGMTQKIVVR